MPMRLQEKKVLVKKKELESKVLEIIVACNENRKIERAP
jgi:hypothetical protein